MATVVRGQVQKKGGNAPLLLFVLIALLGVGAWNYHRNLTAEQNVPKSPFSGISDKDLDVLQAAYQSEVDALIAKGGLGVRANARDNTGGVGRGAREFERVQRVMRTTREKGYEVAERQVAIEAIEKEKAQRKAVGGTQWEVFLRRAFTF